MNRKYINMDDQTALFFERSLEFVKSKTYDIRFPALKARMLIPVSNEAGPGAETIKYEQWRELFAWFLVPGLGCLLAGAMLEHTRLRRLP